MARRFLSSSAEIAVVGLSSGLSGRLSRFEPAVRAPLSHRQCWDANARPGSFADAFFFGVEIISTIGYGQMPPATFYGNIVTVEAMVGLTLLAVSAGLVLGRFTRPTARVMFSRVVVVTPFNSAPTLYW
jgi:hypothetical protein